MKRYDDKNGLIDGYKEDERGSDYIHEHQGQLALVSQPLARSFNFDIIYDSMLCRFSLCRDPDIG